MVAYTQAATGKMGGLFSDLGGVLTKAFVIGGVADIIDKGMDLASQQESIQAVQANLIKNQGLSGAAFVGNLSTVAGSVSALKKDGEQYSKVLNQQATTLSLQTGIQKNQIVQAQNLLLPNQDLANLYKKMPQTFQQTLSVAANVAAVMGNSSGGLTSSARMLARVMADPAKHMSAMTRMGIQLSKQEQLRIGRTEAMNGLMAAQEQFLQLINKHTKGAAEAAMSPVERMQNDLNLLMQTLGTGLLPILDQMASILTVTLQPLLNVITAAASAFTPIATAIGKDIGNLLVAFQPLINLMVNGIIPAIMSIFQPIFGFITTIATDLNSLFNNKAIKTLLADFSALADEIVKALMPGLDALMKVFKQMESDGTLDALMKSWLAVLQAIMPILPAMATAFANILIAIAPLIEVGAKWFTTFALGFAKVEGWLVRIVDDVTKWATHWNGILEIAGGALLAFFGAKFAINAILMPFKAIGQGAELAMKALERLVVVQKSAFGNLSGANPLKYLGQYRLGIGKGQEELAYRKINELVNRGEMPVRLAERYRTMTQMQGPSEKAAFRQERRGELYAAIRQQNPGALKNYLLGNLSPEDIQRMNSNALVEVAHEQLDVQEKTLAQITEMGIGGSGSNTAQNVAKAVENVPGFGSFTREENGLYVSDNFSNPKTAEAQALLAESAVKQTIASENIAKSMRGSRFFGALGGMGRMGGGLMGAGMGAGMAAMGFMGGNPFANLSSFSTLGNIGTKKSVDFQTMANSAMQLSMVLSGIGPMFTGIKDMVSGLGNVFSSVFSKAASDAVASTTEMATAVSGETATATAETTTKYATMTMEANAAYGEITAIATASNATIAAEEAGLMAEGVGFFAEMIAGWTATAVAVFAATWPIALVVLAIAGVIAITYVLVTHWNTVKKFVVDVWHAIVDAAKWAGTEIMKGLDAVGDWFTSLWNTITKLGTTIWDGMYNGFVDTVNLIIKAWDALTGWIPWLGGAVHVNTLSTIGGPSTATALAHSATAVASGNTAGIGGGTVQVASGAIQINVNGTTDPQHVADLVAHHVNEQVLKPLRYTLKTRGR
jgi:hypothetical protein